MKILLPLIGTALAGLASAAPLAQQVYVKPADTTAQLAFGGAVAVSGDTVAVGADGIDRGVYIFVRNGATWSQQGYDFKGSNSSNPAWSDHFGNAVALSGDTLVVGAYWESNSATGVNGNLNNGTAGSSGAAYVFTRSGGTWTQQAYLKASNTEATDWFGRSVAISGDTIVIGAPNESSAATGVNGDQTSNAAHGSGAAYVFTRSGGTWTQQAYLKAGNTSSFSSFGTSVAISGDTIVAGATSDWDATTSAGAAYVFTRSGSTWTQEALLKASNAAAGDSFGTCVAVSGNTVVVGAPAEDSSSSGVNGNQADNSLITTGAGYVFTRSGTAWTQEAYLKASNPGKSDRFGSSVAISGDRVLVGSINEDSAAAGLDGDQSSNAATDTGAAYLFTRNGSTWVQQSYIKASNTGAGDLFGSSVAISGDTVVVGTPLESGGSHGVDGNQADESSPGSGAVYISNHPKTVIRALPPAAANNAASGGTQTFPVMLLGGSSEITFGLYHFGSSDLVLTGSPAVTVSGGGDFSVTAQPALQDIPWNGSTTFKVRFTSSVSGLQPVTLSIPTNDPAQNPIEVRLAGRGLSFADDTDGDGVNDGSEFNLTALGFDWQVSQPALANPYLADVNRMQLYTRAQMQALYPGTPLLSKDAATDRFKVTTRWKKSTDLTQFLDFPAPAGSSVSINPSGRIEFNFALPDKAAFFKLDQE